MPIKIQTPPPHTYWKKKLTLSLAEARTKHVGLYSRCWVASGAKWDFCHAKVFENLCPEMNNIFFNVQVNYLP